MVYRTVICVLLTLLPLISGCGLFNDDQTPSPTSLVAPSLAISQTPTTEPTPTPTAGAAQAPPAQNPSPTPVVSTHIFQTSVHYSPPNPLTRPITHGPVTLDERILKADVIARARFRSFSPSSRTFSTPRSGNRYVGYATLTFDILESLKGSTGNAVVVELRAEGFGRFDSTTYRAGTYKTDADAKASVEKWFNTERASRWNDRDAIIFLWTLDNSLPEIKGGRPSTVQYVFVGNTSEDPFAWEHIDEFSIGSDTNKVWLPAATSSSAMESSVSSGGQSFYLDEPSPDSNDTPTISLTDLKARIASVNRMVDTTIVGHRECLIRKLIHERRPRPRMPAIWHAGDHHTGSGQAAGAVAVVHETRNFGGYGSSYILDGPDSGLFFTETPEEDARPSYSMSLKRKRPLPIGQYVNHIGIQQRWMIPCNYVPPHRSEWTVTVTAPTSTLHEAFFDPVTVGWAIAADASNGVLKPASFTGTNYASASLQRISYDYRGVTITLTPHTAIAGHTLDFIAPDGSVILSLHADDATVDAANNTLSWAVASQPWHDGDKLMVRIREAVPASEGVSVSLSEDTFTFSWSVIAVAAEYRAQYRAGGT